MGENSGENEESVEACIYLYNERSDRSCSSKDHSDMTVFFWKNGICGKLIPCPHVQYRFQEVHHLNDHLSRSLAYQLKIALSQPHSIFGDSKYKQTITTALFNHLQRLNHFFHEKNGSKIAKITPAQFARIKSYILKHIDNKVPVRELAALIGVSEGYFYEAFKYTIDITPYKYITRLKMDRAKELLLQGNLPVIRVGMAVGYDNPAHFCKIFKKVTGTTPSSFQRNYRTSVS